MLLKIAGDAVENSDNTEFSGRFVHWFVPFFVKKEKKNWKNFFLLCTL